MNHKAVGCLFLLATGALVTAGRSDEVTKTVPVLQISLAQTRYVLGEPLILRLVLANKSSEKMPRYFLDDEDFRDTDMLITFAGAGQRHVLEMQISGSGAVRVPLGFRMPPTIDPGASWQCEKIFVPTYALDDALSAHAILPTGSYRLSAKVFLPGRKPVGISDSSNAVELQIADPTGDDAKARTLLGSAGMAAFFSGVRGGEPEEIKALLAQYPQSTYARYAQARLLLDRAERWQWHASRASSPADREDLPTFLAESRAYIRRFPDMPLNDNILLWCARLQHMARDEEGSARTLQELIRDYPHSEMIQTARKHMEDWGRSHPAFRTTQPASQTQPASLPEGPPKRIGVVVPPGSSSKPSGN